MNKIIAAAQFANAAHSGQTRKYSGRPYIEHPMRVAGMTALLYPDEDMIAAAWLHDVLEDCPDFTSDRLRVAFGTNVAALVVCLTNPSKGSPLPRAERKKMDHEHLATCSLPVRQLKLLDRIDNVRDLAEAPDTGFKNLYAAETRLLIEAICMPGLVALIQQLERELERLLKGPPK